MSNWIRVTNLPFYYDEEEAINMFGDVGSIKRIHIERVQLLLKSTAFIQFVNGRKARLAAIKKDQIVFADSVIRVQVVWSRKETLTTLKVSNLPLDVTEHSLLEYFSPFGEVVDIDLNKMRDMLMQGDEEDVNNWCDEKMNESMDKGKVAWVSFARVDYTLRACQEMHHSIVTSGDDNSRLCVKLVNPDTRNVKWKRNLFEYVRCSVPSKRSRTKQPETSGSKSSTGSKTNGSVNENLSRAHTRMNTSQCWFTSQVNGGAGVNLIPPVYGNQQTVNVSRFDNTNVQQGHNYLPQLSQSNGKSVSGSPNVVLCEASGFANGGMPSCAYAPLLIPNAGYVTTGNFSPYLTVPHNANYVTSMSACPSVSTPQLTPNGVAFTPQLMASSPNSGPFLPTQVSNHVDGRYLWSPNQIPTLPSVQVSGTNSVSSVVSNTTISNQSSSSSSVANSAGVKVIVTESSNANTMKKTSSTASVASSVSSNNSNSSSIWSDKQRKAGDIIYRELQSEFPSRVAKLTGMLLSLPKDDLNRLLADPNKLKARAYQFCRMLDNN